MPVILAAAPRPNVSMCCAVLCFVTLFLANPSSAEQQDGLVKIRASGFAPGSGPKARNTALHKAERQAVEIVVDDLIGKDRWGVRNPLLLLAHKYKQSSRIISVDKTDGGVRVVAEVYIRNELMREMAATLLLPLLRTPPRVLFLLAEEVVSQTLLSAGIAGFAEIDLMNGFEGTGFTVIRTWRPTSHYVPSELLRTALGSATEAARVGRENNADVIVIGQAKTWIDEKKAQPKSLIVRRLAAKIDLRVVRARDGKILDNLTVEAGVLSAVPADGAHLALRDAARKIRSKAMIAAIFNVLGDQGGPFVTLTINNAGHERNLELIVDELRRHGASSVEILSTRPEVARLRFIYSGKMGPLVRGLESMTDVPYRLEAREIVGRTMIFDAELPSSPE